ncbi:neurotrophin 1 [Stomoxys calcitrans]|uniref:neurotrophin 1 n=1 Tax=Stomoxys calcitrans TaxID=35570 RepID=UPI0027E2D418|nr:neurotrophin 1 [Stomoxys calcitrans]
MKMGQSARCFWWATLYCVLYLVSASDEDLMDFDFSDLKEIDWNYENENSQENFKKSTAKPEENTITFEDDFDLLEEQDNKVHSIPFDWREKLLRTALSKALTNKVVRQKFIEVMPILRVLSRQQKLALSALITAQISAKQGHELKLDQVRMMFGDDKSLILPVVYDIANLVKSSAKKYISFDYSLQDLAKFGKAKVQNDRKKLDLSTIELDEDDNLTNFGKGTVQAERKKLDLSSTELAEDDLNEGIGTLPYTGELSKEDDMEDFMEDMREEYLDPMEINKELQTETAKKAQTGKKAIPVIVAEAKKREELKKPIEEPEVIVDDPIKINLELQKDVPTLELLKGSVPIPSGAEKKLTKSAAASIVSTTPTTLRRTRRATENREFVHKLIRSVPLSVNEADLQRGLAGRTLKLNTTAFASPKESTLKPLVTAEPTVDHTAETPKSDNDQLEPYQLVEDLAFASLNGSEILLGADNQTTEDDITPDNEEEPAEALPTPEELIAGPRYRVSANKIINMRTSGPMPKGKRVLTKVRGRPIKGTGVSPPKKCERFTASMCIRTEDYPIDQIMGSIRRHRNAMTALLAEYNDKLHNVESSDDFDEYFNSKKRRQDTNEVQGGLCQSIVRYARPQKARSASGEWKFIVNTGQHTQTLRLEKCTSPQESCSYLSSSYKSYCSQVYNYHRLLSWDKTRGLHVDIFKVPTCCSCQISGIRQQQFAAVLSSFNKKEYSPAPKTESYRNEPHEYAEEDLDEDEDDDFGFNVRTTNHYKHDSSFDANELLSGSSKRVRTKIPSPTVGSYLSPPGDDEFEQYPYKLPRDTSTVYKHSAPASSVSLSSPSSSSPAGSSRKILRDLAKRRPQKSYSGDYQAADLEYSPSEQHSEREVVAMTALRPSPLAPEPFVHSHHSLAHPQQDDLSLSIPMPTKNHHHSENAAGSDNDRTTLPHESSVSQSTTPAVRAASLPAHYYTDASGGGLKVHRSRVRIAATGTTAGSKTSTTTAIPETTAQRETPSKRPVIPSITSDVFRNPYISTFNLTTPKPMATGSQVNGSTKSPSPPRRINYSYHPIIDFFEYNRRIQSSISDGSTTTPPPSPAPSIAATVRRVRSTARPSYLLSSTQLYAHKIPNAVALNTYHHQNSQQQEQQQQPSTQHNERRIGYGADGDGSSVRTHLQFSHKIQHGDQTPALAQQPFPAVRSQQETEVADVWHPVVLENF